MILRNMDAPRRVGWVVLIASGALTFGFLQTCDDALVQITRYVDPCQTVFANCTPGSFEASRADVGDYCVDPGCTVPGQCPDQGQPLGTITDLCP